MLFHCEIGIRGFDSRYAYNFDMLIVDLPF